ncbi:hypothetical protein ABT124_46630 [Streptomyces sp. NPDC001982]|uniref:hypothetical protein n=1 Tax=Streptomyces sp. NPDC001982 TaxID=3154405 RepID=UPI0033237176
MTGITSVRTWPTDTSTVRSYVDVPNEFITHRPTYMLPVAPQVVTPNLRRETYVTVANPPAHGY